MPDVAIAVVLAALAVALLLGFLSYHAPRRGYVNLGTGLLVLATTVALLASAIARPGASAALVLLLAMLAVMMVLLMYQSRAWAHGVWWIGVLLFLLSLPLLGAGRADLALFALIGGPGLLMLVATLHPEIPAGYARIGDTGQSPPPTREDLAYERNRYTRLAGTITVASLAGVWLFGGIPQGQVVEAVAPLTVDEAAATRGAALFQQYGCMACHSVESQQPGVGPGLKGLGNKRERLADGTVVIAGEDYIRESILQPDAKTVSGYSRGVMSSAVAPYMAEIRQASNLRALVEYIKSLK